MSGFFPHLYCCVVEASILVLTYVVDLCLKFLLYVLSQGEEPEPDAKGVAGRVVS